MSRKKIKNRGRSNRARRRYEQRTRDRDYWLAVHYSQDDDRYSLKCYTSVTDAIRDWSGTELFGAWHRNQMFDYLHRERYKQHALLTGKKYSEIGFPSVKIRDEYQAYQADLLREEVAPDSTASPL